MSCGSFSHRVSACNGAKKWGTLWPAQKERIYRAVQVNNKVLCTGHLSLSGCNPWEFKTPLCITVSQNQELDTTHLLLQPLQEKTPHRPCSLGVMSWSFSALLGNCWQPHLWKFCSTAPISKRPNYSSRELPLQTSMAWPLQYKLKVIIPFTQSPQDYYFTMYAIIKAML